MVRSVPEWIGASDDTPVPARVKDRLFDKYDGMCAACGRKLRPGHWSPDHITAIINKGENRESNLQPLCDVPCHSQKTRSDVAQKSRSYGLRKSDRGIRSRKGRSFPTNKDQRWKQKIGGRIVPRERKP